MAHFGDKSNSSEQLREILQPTALRRGHVPRWIAKAVKVAVEEGRLPGLDLPVGAIRASGTALDTVTRKLGRSWKDHVGTLTWDGIECLVSEPYAERIDLRMLTELESFTKALGAAYFFSGNSEHFPGRTVRIIIAPTQHDASEYRKHEWHSSMERLNATAIS